MAFKRAVSRLMLGLLLAMAAMAASAAYWAVSGDLSLMRRDDNPRLMEAEAAIRRGAIYSRDGILLAESIPDPLSSRMRRQYNEPDFFSALGYYSLRYGTGGTEAAFDDILRGDTLPDDISRHFEQNFLHRPQTGSDVQLTLDATVQTILAEAMDGHSGAAVMISTPRGEVVAMVSLPAFNPNELDAQWASLIEDDGKPFFNRVLQGRYQPGTVLLTPLMVQALLSETDLNQIYPDATEPVQVDDALLTCAITPSDPALTLAQAYSYGCPKPFQTLAVEIGESQIRTIFDDFRLSSSPQLDEFATQNNTGGNSSRVIRADELTAVALGQSDLTVSPLRMAAVAAAIINDGNAPLPQVLNATRAPGNEAWQNTVARSASEALMTASVARRLRELMVSNVRAGGLSSVFQEGINAGGQAAIAYAGSSAQAWFIGFATNDAGRGTAIAVVLEDSSDALSAARIGTAALVAAQHSSVSAYAGTSAPE